MRRTAIVTALSLAALGQAGCAKTDAADPLALRAEPVLATRDGTAPAPSGKLIYRGGFSLSAPGLGGLSAADVNDDGTVLTAISDTGNWYRFSLTAELDRSLSEVRLTGAGRLLNANGLAFRTKREGDAESMVRRPDGRVVVGFETQSKILTYPPDLAGEPTQDVTPPGLGNGNRGLEAMTLLADGRILAVSEGGPRVGGRAPAWIGNGIEWRPRLYGLVDGFRPTGATTLPDGDILIIERRFSFPAKFATRFVRITPTQLLGEVISGDEIARLESPFPVDNFEAVAAYADGDGRVFLYILSDNNFSRFQRTLLLKFELTD